MPARSRTGYDPLVVDGLGAGSAGSRGSAQARRLAPARPEDGNTELIFGERGCREAAGRMQVRGGLSRSQN
jgi:hypothetical protein